MVYHRAGRKPFGCFSYSYFLQRGRRRRWAGRPANPGLGWGTAWHKWRHAVQRTKKRLKSQTITWLCNYKDIVTIHATHWAAHRRALSISVQATFTKGVACANLPNHRNKRRCVSTKTCKITGNPTWHCPGVCKCCLYALAWSALKKAQGQFVGRTMAAIWAIWSHVGSLIGVQTEHTSLVLLYLRSSRALTSPDWATPGERLPRPATA